MECKVRLKGLPTVSTRRQAMEGGELLVNCFSRMELPSV
jgi:hypothetical protein